MNHLAKKAFLRSTYRIALPLLAALLAAAALDNEQGGPPPLPELPEKDAAILDAVRRAQAGDETSFTILYHSYHRRIYYYLLRMVGNPEDASDLAAETFVKAWRGIPGILDGRRFSAWLYSIATRAALDYLRRQKRGQALWGDPDEEPGDEHTFSFESRIEEQELVRLALEQVAPKPRACLLLQLEGFSQAEIADLVGLQRKSVGTYVSMAREQFRRAYRRLRNG
jgi:RNA polymerase sigma-70 factor, ECF subfamily